MIDVEQHPDIARQFGVTGVPTYVALAGGREAGRVVGAASYERLVTLCESAGIKLKAKGAGNGLATTDYRAAATSSSAGARVSSFGLQILQDPLHAIGDVL